MRPTLLLIRPEPQSRRFAAAFRACFGSDWPILIAPLVGLRRLETPDLPTGITDLIFTSETAVAAAAPLQLGPLRAWCVGRRTAEAARSAGHPAEVGPGDGEALAEFIATRHPTGHFLHLRGRDVAVDLQSALQRRGIDCRSAVVYEQVPVAPGADLLALLDAGRPVLLPLFSPNAARAVAGLPSRAPLLVAAMSPAVAAVPLPAVRRLETATTPDAEAMLDALGRLVESIEET